MDGQTNGGGGSAQIVEATDLPLAIPRAQPVGPPTAGGGGLRRTKVPRSRCASSPSVARGAQQPGAEAPSSWHGASALTRRPRWAL